jgi:pimeloyl-ACP methyl ester carboxylesterase
VVNNLEADKYAYRWALEHARRDGRRAAVRLLEQLVEEPRVPPLRATQGLRWVMHYGGYVDFAAMRSQRRARPARQPQNPLLSLWGCPDYTLADLVHALSAPFFAGRALWGEILDFDVMVHAARIDVPVYLLQGRNDIPCPTFLVERYFNALDAPMGKRLVIFERSPHVVHYTEREEYLRVLTEMIPDEVPART